MQNRSTTNKHFRPSHLLGFGGVAVGNGFNVHSDISALQTIQAAWDSGVRYFDTSPWYGLGISERRMGLFLKDKPKEEYTLSTKIGRILSPDEQFRLENTIWKGKLTSNYRYDYTAAGTRKSVEDSLLRMGVSSIDIVFIHDLSPDNGDMKENWTSYFDEAAKGAMPELIKMREEGLIKGWGFGVNRIEPILKAIEVSDPDIFLSACQYSLIKHEDALEQVFPIAEERGISIVVGAPYCAGFLSGQDRYLYGPDIPNDVKLKLEQLQKIATEHKVNLKAASLQFSAAPSVVSSVIPGASSAVQAIENTRVFNEMIPSAFWDALKAEKLIHPDAAVPNS